MVTPQKTFESYKINPNRQESDDLPAGTRINVSIQFKTPGVYILEVNNAGGSAIINTPCYVGDIYPLLPDYVDLSSDTFEPINNNMPSILS